MTDFLNITNPVARKQYRCEACGEPIRIGEKYIRITGIFCGAFSYEARHKACYDQPQKQCQTCPLPKAHPVYDHPCFDGGDIKDCDMQHAEHSNHAQVCFRKRRGYTWETCCHGYMSPKLNKYQQTKVGKEEGGE